MDTTESVATARKQSLEQTFAQPIAVPHTTISRARSCSTSQTPAQSLAGAYKADVEEAIELRDQFSAKLSAKLAPAMRSASQTNMSLQMPDNTSVMAQLLSNKHSAEPISPLRPQSVRMDESVVPITEMSFNLASLPTAPPSESASSQTSHAHRARSMISTIHAATERQEVAALALQQAIEMSTVTPGPAEQLLIEQFCEQLVPAEPGMYACARGTSCIAMSALMAQPLAEPLKAWQPVRDWERFKLNGTPEATFCGGFCGLDLLYAMNRGAEDAQVRAKPSLFPMPFVFYVDRPGGVLRTYTIRYDSLPGPVLKFAPHYFETIHRTVNYRQVEFRGTSRPVSISETRKTVVSFKINPSLLYTSAEDEESRQGTLLPRAPALRTTPVHGDCDLFTVLRQELSDHVSIKAAIDDSAGASGVPLRLAIEHLVVPLYDTLVWLSTTPTEMLMSEVFHFRRYSTRTCNEIHTVMESAYRDAATIARNRVVLAVFWRIGFALEMQSVHNLVSNNNLTAFIEMHAPLLNAIVAHEDTTTLSVVSDERLFPALNVPASAVALDAHLRAANLLPAAPAAFLTGARERQVPTRFVVESRPRLPTQVVRSYFLPHALREASDRGASGRSILLEILRRCVAVDSPAFAYSREAVALVVADDVSSLTPESSTAHLDYFFSTVVGRVFAPLTPPVLALVLLVCALQDNIEDAAWLMRKLFHPLLPGQQQQFHPMDPNNIAAACLEFPHWSMAERADSAMRADWSRVVDGTWRSSRVKPRIERDIMRDTPIYFTGTSSLTADVGAYNATVLSVLTATAVAVHVLSQLEHYNAARLVNEYTAHVEQQQRQVETDRQRQRADEAMQGESQAHSRAHALVAEFRRDEPQRSAETNPVHVHTDRVPISDPSSTTGGILFADEQRAIDGSIIDDEMENAEEDGETRRRKRDTNMLNRVVNLLAQDPYRQERSLPRSADEDYEARCSALLDELMKASGGSPFCNDRTDIVPEPKLETPPNPVFMGAQPSARRTRVYNLRVALAELMPVVCVLERGLRRDDTSYRSYQSMPGSAGVFPAAPGTAPCEDNLLDLTPLISEMGLVRQSCEVGSFQSNVTQSNTEATWVTSVGFVLQLCCTIRDFPARHARAMHDGMYANWSAQALLVSLLGTYRHAVSSVPFELGWRLYQMFSIDRVACSSDNQIFQRIRDLMCNLWVLVVCALRENMFFQIASLPAYSEVICSVWKDLRLVMGVHVPDVSDRIRRLMADTWLAQTAERRSQMATVGALLKTAQVRITRYVVNSQSATSAAVARAAAASTDAALADPAPTGRKRGAAQPKPKRARTPTPTRARRAPLVFGMSDDEGDEDAAQSSGESDADNDADAAAAAAEELDGLDEIDPLEDGDTLLGCKSTQRLSTKVFRRVIPPFLRLGVRISADIEREDWTETHMRDPEVKNLLPPVREMLPKEAQINLQHHIQCTPAGSALSVDVLRKFNVTARSLLLLYLCNRLYLRHGRDWSLAPCLRKMRRYDFMIIWNAMYITTLHNGVRVTPLSMTMASAQYRALLARTGIAPGEPIPAHFSYVWMCHPSGCQQIRTQFVPLQSKYNYGIAQVPTTGSAGMVCRHRTEEQVIKPVRRRVRDGDVGSNMREFRDAFSWLGTSNSTDPAEQAAEQRKVNIAMRNMRLSISKAMRVAVATMWKQPCASDILRRAPAMGAIVNVARGSMRCSAANVTVAPCCGAMTLVTHDRWGPNMLECGQCNTRDRRIRHGTRCIGCDSMFMAKIAPPLAGELQARQATTAAKSARADPNVAGSSPPCPASPGVSSPASVPTSPMAPMSPAPDTPSSAIDDLEQMHEESGRRAASAAARKTRTTKRGVRNNRNERLTDKITIDRYLLYDDRPEAGTGFFRVVGICSRCIANVPNSARFMVSSVLNHISHAHRQVYLDGAYLQV